MNRNSTFALLMTRRLPRLPFLVAFEQSESGADTSGIIKVDNNTPDGAMADSEVGFGESITHGIAAFFTRCLDICHVIEDGVARVCIPLGKDLQGLWTDAKALLDERPDEHDESAVPREKFDTNIFHEIFIGAERKEQLHDLDGEFSLDETPEEKDSAFRLVVGTSTFAITLLGSLHLLPGFGVLGAAGLVYQVIPIFTDAYHALVDEGRISFYVLNSALIVMATLSGSLLAVTGSVAGVSLLRWLTAKTEGVAQRSLASVFSKQPRSVYVVQNEVEVEVPFDQVRIGDTIVLRAGDMIPADGLVLDGVASVDQGMLTGEAQPVDRSPGDSVLASTMILQGRIHLRVARSGMDTVAAQVARALIDTSKYKRELKARTEQRLDTLSIPFLALIIVATYRKCGTTWMLQIAHQLRTCGSMDFDDICDVVPWIEVWSQMDRPVDVEQVANPRVFKSHLPYEALPTGGNSSACCEILATHWCRCTISSMARSCRSIVTISIVSPS